MPNPTPFMEDGHPELSDSILTSEKKMLGIEEDYEEFDPELIVYINTIFGTLEQLGIRSGDKFRIQDKFTTWTDYLDDYEMIDEIKSYMYLRLRLLFDPPSNSFIVNSFDDQIKEFEWRINVKGDTTWEDYSD